MILLEPGNRILGEAVSAQINGGGEAKEAKREPIDVRLCDFDDVSYRIVIDAKAKNFLKVSMNLPCYASIKDYGASAALQKIYGDLSVTPEDGSDITIQVDLDKESKEEKKEEVIKNLTLLKPNIVGAVFKHFYTQLKNGEASDPFKFDLRKDTTVYFIPDKDKKERVVTVFGLDFHERVDKAVARVFLQEFVDARKTVGFAPPVQFGNTPPSELKAFGITEPTGNLGFISFAILKDHVKSEEVITKIVNVLQSFRNYLQYHIKCSKSYFHARMRARARDLLKVLNRAKLEDPEGDKTKRTITGKTFTRAT